MPEPTFVVPPDYSELGQSIPPGQTPFYSCQVMFKNMKARMAPGIAGIIAEASTTYRTHMILTDGGALYLMKKGGSRYVPWGDIDFIRESFSGPWMRTKDWNALILVYDKKTGEDKNAWKMRKKRFIYDVLPSVTTALKAEIESASATGAKERDIKKLQKKLMNNEKLYVKVEKKMAKLLK
jgi:hypothetical protein